MKTLLSFMVLMLCWIGIAQAGPGQELLLQARQEAERGRYMQAEKLVSRGLATGELTGAYLADATYLRARLRDRLGRPEEAIADYSKVLSMAPDDFNSHINRGGCYLALGRLQLALEDYNQAARIKPDHPYPYNNRSVVLEKMGKIKEAVADMEKALQLAPDKQSYQRRLEVLRKLLQAMRGN